MGILENFLAAIQANTAALNALAQAQGGGASPNAGLTNGAGTAGTLTATLPQTTDTGAAITADAITALIQPHIANDAIKGALGAAMRGMGINALPETQPHQFASLYQAFKNVIAQHTQTNASASII